MRQDFIEFAPTHKLFLATNHKPMIKGTDLGIWRRVLLWPLTVSIPPEEQDTSLAEKLREEGPGILAWAVRGCLDWLERDCKLAPPACVTAATEEYRSDSDVVGRWLEESCILDPQSETMLSGLFDSYGRWAEQAKEQAATKIQFSKLLQERGFAKRKTKGVIYFRGLRPCVG